jgi:hypothetical protein
MASKGLQTVVLSRKTYHLESRFLRNHDVGNHIEAAHESCNSNCTLDSKHAEKYGTGYQLTKHYSNVLVLNNFVIILVTSHCSYIAPPSK